MVRALSAWNRSKLLPGYLARALGWVAFAISAATLAFGEEQKRSGSCVREKTAEAFLVSAPLGDTATELHQALALKPAAQMPRPPKDFREAALENPFLRDAVEQLGDGQGVVFFMADLKVDGTLPSRAQGEGKASMQTLFELKTLFPKATFRFGMERLVENQRFLKSKPGFRPITVTFLDSAEMRKRFRDSSEIEWDPNEGFAGKTLEMVFRKAARVPDVRDAEAFRKALGLDETSRCAHYYLKAFYKADRITQHGTSGFYEILDKTLGDPTHVAPRDYVFLTANGPVPKPIMDELEQMSSPALRNHFSAFKRLSELRPGELAHLHVSGKKPVLILNDYDGVKSSLDVALSGTDSFEVVLGPINGFESHAQGLPTAWLITPMMAEEWYARQAVDKIAETAKKMGIGFAESPEALTLATSRILFDRKLHLSNSARDPSWALWIDHLGHWFNSQLNLTDAELTEIIGMAHSHESDLAKTLIAKPSRQVPRPPVDFKEVALKNPDIAAAVAKLGDGKDVAFVFTNLSSKGELSPLSLGEGKASMQTLLELKTLFPKAVFKFYGKNTSINSGFFGSRTRPIRVIHVSFVDAAETTRVARDVNELRVGGNSELISLEMAFRKPAKAPDLRDKKELMDALGLESGDRCTHFYLKDFLDISGDIEAKKTSGLYELLQNTVLRSTEKPQDFVFLTTNAYMPKSILMELRGQRSPILKKSFSAVRLLSELKTGELRRLRSRNRKPVLIVNDLEGSKGSIDVAISGTHAQEVVVGPINGFEAHALGIPTAWLIDSRMAFRWYSAETVAQFASMSKKVGIGFVENMSELGQAFDHVAQGKTGFQASSAAGPEWSIWIEHFGHWLKDVSGATTGK